MTDQAHDIDPAELRDAVPGLTVDEVLEVVDGDPERAAVALEAEQARGDAGRSTLIAKLRDLTAADDGSPDGPDAVAVDADCSPDGPDAVAVDADCTINYSGQLLRLTAGRTLHGGLARYAWRSGAPVSTVDDGEDA